MIINLLFFSALSLVPTNDTVHVQKVTYELGLFKGSQGTLILTDQGIHFRTNNNEKKERDFFIPYQQVHRVKAAWWYVFPNRIRIRTRSGEKYTLYTYRRKTILRLIAANSNRKQ